LSLHSSREEKTKKYEEFSFQGQNIKNIKILAILAFLIIVTKNVLPKLLL